MNLSHWFSSSCGTQREKERDWETRKMETQTEMKQSKFKRICVFCGSSPGNKSTYRDAAIELGRELVMLLCLVFSLHLPFQQIGSSKKKKLKLKFVTNLIFLLLCFLYWFWVSIKHNTFQQKKKKKSPWERVGKDVFFGTPFVLYN